MCLVRVFIFVKKAEQMYEITIFKSVVHREERRDERRVQRGEETKIKKKLIRWVWAQSKKIDKWVQFYYGSAIGNISLLFKISSGHIPKHTVQTWVLEQQFPNNPILNSVTKHIFPNFGHLCSVFKHYTLCFEKTDQTAS